MLFRFRVGRFGGSLVVAAGLIASSGCTSDGLTRGPDCAADKLVAYPASGHGPADLVLKARVVDSHGKGVPNLPIDFSLYNKEKDGGGYVASTAAKTGSDGVASARLPSYYGTNPIEEGNARQAVRYKARFQQALIDAPKHPYCDTSGTSTVRYDG
ncbi:MAG: hypothetical protein QOG34_2473 [Frankiaceae bacterium]|nr:hypothetical protein [Frankiaceae bacterium]